jgi:hypothetical protein
MISTMIASRSFEGILKNILMQRFNFCILSSAVMLGVLFETDSAWAAVGVEVYCFSSMGEQEIRFEMREYTDSANALSAAFIRYEKSKTWVPLVLQYRNAEIVAGATQAEVVSTWLEIVGSKVAGVYEMVSQAALVNSMRYKNAISKRQYDFLRDAGVEFSVEKGCRWSKS